MLSSRPNLGDLGGQKVIPARRKMVKKWLKLLLDSIWLATKKVLLADVDFNI